jgi:hypothetical protein
MPEAEMPKSWTIVDQMKLDQDHYGAEWHRRQKKLMAKNRNYQPKPFPGYKSSAGNGMADGA